MNHTIGSTYGCTVGVVHVPGGILFFKNRDLEGRYLARRVTVLESTPDWHALRGVNLQTGALEGVSIGVNRHRVCVANTHVLSTPDATYDLLCERLLQEVRSPAEVPSLVDAFLAAGPLQGGRVLVAAPGWAFLVEVLGREHAVQPVEGNWAMTNTFALLPQPPGRPPAHEESSAVRLETARHLLPAITGLGPLKAMLRSHLPERGPLSICNHHPDGGGTEGSYMVHVQGQSVAWSTLLGFPCENDYHTQPLFDG